MKHPDATADRFRSLLQKAVRRGHGELALTVCALIEARGLLSAEWLEKRAAVIVFEECWPLGGALRFTRGFHSKVAALMQVAGSRKLRDASGLGYLAYGLSRGEESVLAEAAAEPEAEAALRRLAAGMRTPAAFWGWVEAQPAAGEARAIAARARRYLQAGRPHDQAVIQAAAYLAAGSALPAVEPVPAPSEPFPYWIVFDRHTTEGRRALYDVARDLHLPLPLLEWVLYYYEGSRADAERPSLWWQRYCRWRFRRIGLAPEEAELVWKPAGAQVREALGADARALQAEIYRWKLANLERIASLRRQVALFRERPAPVGGEAPELF